MELAVGPIVIDDLLIALADKILECTAHLALIDKDTNSHLHEIKFP